MEEGQRSSAFPRCCAMKVMRSGVVTGGVSVGVGRVGELIHLMIIDVMLSSVCVSNMLLSPWCACSIGHRLFLFWCSASYITAVRLTWHTSRALTCAAEFWSDRGAPTDTLTPRPWRSARRTRLRFCSALFGRTMAARLYITRSAWGCLMVNTWSIHGQYMVNTSSGQHVKQSTHQALCIYRMCSSGCCKSTA